MVQYSSNLLTLSIALSTPALNQKPAGGWGSWIGSPAPVDESISAGTTIYTLTTTDVQQLRTNGLITDESLVYFQARIFNTTLAQSQTCDRYSFGIPSARILRSLTALQTLGFIQQFSTDDINISWIAITPALTETQIRTYRNTGVLKNDVTYVQEVLNLLRSGGTTQIVDVKQLQADWAITPLMLGDALVSMESRKVCTSYFNTLSLKWFSPVLGAAVSKQELLSLSSRAIIGETLFIYCCVRSGKAGASQLINPAFLESQFAIAHSSLFKVMVSLWEQGLTTSLDINTVTIKWLDPVPNYSLTRVSAIQRSFLKEAGRFMFSLGGENPNLNSTQSLNLTETVKKYSLYNSAKEDPHTEGLKYLNRMVEQKIVSVTLPSFSVSWAL